MSRVTMYPSNEAKNPDMQLPFATFIHVSDLHFGKDFTNDEDQLSKIASMVPLLGGVLPHSYQASRALALRTNQILQDRAESGVITVVAFTGDLTSAGEEAEFLVGNTFLRSSHCLGAGNYVGLELREDLPASVSGAAHPLLFPIPGNHDIWNRSDPRLLGVYRRTFPGSYPVTLKIETSGPRIHLHGVDSTLNSAGRHKLARGRVPIEDLEILEQRLVQGSKEGAIQIVCIHHTPRDPAAKHHFDPTMTLEDREVVAKRLFEAGADLVLSGHVHEWFVEPLVQNESPAQLTIGTATQQFSERSFALLDVYEKIIRVAVFEFDHTTSQFVRRDISHDIPFGGQARAVRA